jgi:FkbM family methyltransferase
MSLTSRLRVAAFSRLPKHWQPAVNFYYYRARSLLEPELAVVCRGLGRGTRAIDVGANEGVYTHAFVSTGALVEAFEPHPKSLDVLRGYARHHPNVRVHGMALGDRPHAATLHVPAIGGRAVPGRASLEAVPVEAMRYEVEVRTLDSFNFDDVAVIKIDVEGRELDVLQGARGTVTRSRPVLLLEIEQRHLRVPMQTVFAAVKDLGYAGNFLLPHAGAVPLDEFDPSEHQQAVNADRPHALYVNNFIFSPNAKVFAVAENARA